MRILSLLTILLFSNIAFAQTIVSTNSENKNVILEEFTGIHCGYCPEGHVIAQGIKDAHPDDVFLINIHQGYFATPTGDEPDFRTSFGDALASQSNVTGYPMATVNRHENAIGRGEWTTKSNQRLAESSYVNVGVEATLNVETREISVHVETYYTANSPETSNYLNVVLLQDSTIAQQSSGGDNYNHMHRLIHMITGQWGVVVTPTTTGSFFDNTFTYSIPANHNNMPIILKNLKVVAFISETHKDIISGNGCVPTYSGPLNDAAISEIIIPEVVCGDELTPVIKLENSGANNITSATIKYSVNEGTESTYNWTGNLSYGYSTTITLPNINYSLQATNTLKVSIFETNGDTDGNALNNILEKTFNEPYNSTTRVYLEIDPNGSFGLPWTLKDNAGTTIYSGTASGSEIINETFDLTIGECYTFDFNSSFNNGIPGDGYCKITDSDGSELFHVVGNEFSDNIFTLFRATTVASVNSNTNTNIAVYPNPAKNTVLIKSDRNINKIEISNISGKLVLTKKINTKSKVQISTSSLKNGIYFISIISDFGVISTKKISIIK